MEKLILNKNDSIQDNILKIIEHVKKQERNNGLTDEQISYKYIHGDCSVLVNIIKQIYPEAQEVLFGEGEYGHFCVSIKGNPAEDSKLEDFHMEDRYYFDINGRKYFDEMREFISEEFKVKIDRVSAARTNMCTTNNNISLDVVNSISIVDIKDKVMIDKEEKEDIKDDRTIRSLKWYKNYLSKDEKVLIGILSMSSRGYHESPEALRMKTKEEIIKILISRNRLDEAGTAELLELDDSSLKEILIKCGYKTKDFAGKSRKEIENLAIELIGDKSLLNVIEKTEVEDKKEKVVKKAVSKEEFKKLIKSPISRGKLALLGYPAKTTEGKTEEELRTMLLEKITLDVNSVIDILCGGGYDLKETLMLLGVPGEEFKGKTRDDAEKMFISKIGIDEVVEASKIVKEQEKTSGTRKIHRYENSLQAMRLERGKQINQEIKNMGLKTKEEKREYAKKLSAYEIEDAERFYDIDRQLAKSSQTMADIITKS